MSNKNELKFIRITMPASDGRGGSFQFIFCNNRLAAYKAHS